MEAEVGDFLGYGRGVKFGEERWDAKQQRDITSCLKSGLRQFYYPKLQQNSNSVYDWSFLKPFTTMTLLTGERTITMPDDFGGFAGAVTIEDASSIQPWSLKQYNEGYLNRLYAQSPSHTGSPRMWAERVIKGTSLKHGQNKALFVFPQADADYDLTFQYSINPDFLTGDKPYAYGGAEHAETLIAACKAAAELDRDDSRQQRMDYFNERLAVSISMDRKHSAQFLGYNSDHSDRLIRTPRELHGFGVVTIGGLTPD